ncbi:uncharacterized protein PG986_002142 [Apiospora aurea]|uniref:Ubiquitin-like domain-containing protein n=1 Tax=Apiospora aurea TaxID=335848 RepID=A0ABR1QYU4_9PEZI
MISPGEASTSKYVCSIDNDAIEITRTEPPILGDSWLKIQFMRTIRVPDNTTETLKLPPGLGRFALSQVSKYEDNLPINVSARGGVFFIMHPNESMWVSFKARDPFMVKLYAGGVNGLSGEYKFEDAETIVRRQHRYRSGQQIQDYIVTPGQQWLDGIAVSPGVFRQFKALPSGQDYSFNALFGKPLRASESLFQLGGEHEVVVYSVGGGAFSFCCDVNIEVLDIKKAIKRWIGIKHDDMTFIYDGRRLKDNKTLFDYQHRDGDSITLAVHRGGDTGASFIEHERSVQVAAGGVVEQNIKRDWLDPKGWEPERTITIPVHILNPEAYLQAGLSLFNIGQAHTFRSVQSIVKAKRNWVRTYGVNKNMNPQLIELGGKEGQGFVAEDDINPVVNLHGVVANPDDLVNFWGPFRYFRVLADLEKEL